MRRWGSSGAPSDMGIREQRGMIERQRRQFGKAAVAQAIRYVICASAASNKQPYIALELDQPATMCAAYENHKKSVEFLRRKFGG